ncbi:MAG: hypothetical protein ACRD1Z_22705 [Vicinamibacteria bacterium]
MNVRRILILTGLLGWGAPFPGFSFPLIHEVFYDAAGTDAAHVFTEISGLPGTTLDGYRLVGIDGATGLSYRRIDLTGATIPSDGLLVIATVRAVGELLSVRDFIADVDWQNGPDGIQLWDPVGVIVDALQYGDAGAHHFGEGLFALDPEMGFSLTRDLESSDTGDNRTDFAVSTPTPGTGRALSSVPEPATPLVLVLGLLFLLPICGAPSVGRAPAGAPQSPVRSRPC